MSTRATLETNTDDGIVTGQEAWRSHRRDAEHFVRTVYSQKKKYMRLGKDMLDLLCARLTITIQEACTGRVARLPTKLHVHRTLRTPGPVGSPVARRFRPVPADGHGPTAG